MCGSSGDGGLNAIGTCPPMTLCKVGPVPRNGTWVMSSLASILSSSPARCAGVPLPPEPKLSFPGFALACATSSANDLAGTAGCR